MAVLIAIQSIMRFKIHDAKDRFYENYQNLRKSAISWENISIFIFLYFFEKARVFTENLLYRLYKMIENSYLSKMEIITRTAKLIYGTIVGFNIYLGIKWSSIFDEYVSLKK